MSAPADIESFAALMARLDDPFADRAALLRSAGLDEAAYRRRLDGWSADLESAPSPDLAQRFGDAYERAVRAIAAVRSGGRAAPDPRFLNADVQPFREEAAAVALHAPAEALPRAAPAAPWVPEGMRGFTSLRETQASSDVPQGPVLPFDPSAAPTLPRAASPALLPVEPGSLVPEGMRGFTSLRETQASSDVPKGPALPFPPSRSARGGEAPQLSLERYASLCVEIAAAPAKVHEILERYRITEEQRRAIDASWSERMSADPSLRAAWQRACAAYKAWLLQSQGGKR